MTYFIDASVAVYAASEGDYRDACLDVLAAIADGADGRTSTAVLEEVWHLECSGRIPKLDGLAERMYRLFSPLLPVTDEVFVRALSIDVPQLGTNDRVHVSTCLVHGIETIVTADRGFDHAPRIRRVDPLDADARDALLAKA